MKLPDSIEKLRDRFLKRLIKKDGCWDFKGVPKTGGYHTIRLNYKTLAAHRVSWFIFKNEWPPQDKFVCHSCDNRRCQNPEHLFLGTAKDNVRDMLNKGRQVAQRKTHCKQGHEFTKENTYMQGKEKTKRGCKTCRKILWKAQYAKSKVAWR